MSKLIDALFNSDPVSFGNDIADILADKVTDAIDAKKVEVAQSLIPEVHDEDIEEEIDDDFESAYDYSEEQEDDNEVVNAIDDLPGAGSMKGANLPTDDYELTGDELSDMEYREVESVRPAYVRGENGVYTHANEAVELDEISKKTLGSYVKRAHDDAGERERREGRKEAGIGGGGGRRDRERRERETKTDARKMKNRRKGVMRAVDRLAKEDAEHVDEGLLGKAIGGYTGYKAGGAAGAVKGAMAGDMAQKAIGAGIMTGAAAAGAAAKALAKRRERKAEQKRAARARQAEEIELDEISKKTLGSYVKQAHDDAGARERVSGRREGGIGGSSGRRDRADREIQTKIDDRKMKNRRKGISRAVARLAKEDAEQVDENVFHCLERVAGTNRGSKYRFNDGSVANISVDAATKMLQTYGSLNPKNQGRFAQMAQESKDGFNRLSEFAFSYKQGH